MISCLGNVVLPELSLSQELTQEKYPNVSQLTDISSQDWAFRALQSLISRYNCWAGYPDLTYQGDRHLTREQFASALKACSDRLVQKSQTVSD